MNQLYLKKFESGNILTACFFLVCNMLTIHLYSQPRTVHDIERVEVGKTVTIYWKSNDNTPSKSRAEKEEERRYQERWNEINNNYNSIIYYYKDPDYRYIIESNPNFRDRLIWRLKDSNSDYFLDYLDNDALKKFIFSETLLKDRLKRIIRNRKNGIFTFLKDPDIRRFILTDEDLRKDLRDQLWENKENILNYYKDPDLRQIILTDRFLADHYDTEVKLQDIMNHPNKILDYISDPKMKEIILNDPSLRDLFVEKNLERAIENEKQEKRRIELAKQEADRQEAKKQAEIIRVKDEKKRADEQTRQNELELQSDHRLEAELRPLKPTQHQGEIPRTSILDMDDNDELFEDPTCLHARLNNTVYHTKEKVEEAFDKTKTILKQTPDKLKKETKSRMTSIPVNKGRELAQRTLEMAYPEANLYGRIQVFKDQKKDEVKATTNILRCVKYAVVDNDLKKTEACVNSAVNDLKNNTKSNFSKAIQAPGLVRKAMKWIVFSDQSDKNENQDEED